MSGTCCYQPIRNCFNCSVESRHDSCWRPASSCHISAQDTADLGFAWSLGLGVRGLISPRCICCLGLPLLLALLLLQLLHPLGLGLLMLLGCQPALKIPLLTAWLGCLYCSIMHMKDADSADNRMSEQSDIEGHSAPLVLAFSCCSGVILHSKIHIFQTVLRRSHHVNPPHLLDHHLCAVIQGMQLLSFSAAALHSRIAATALQDV